jgi:hypothetical protein
VEGVRGLPGRRRRADQPRDRKGACCVRRPTMARPRFIPGPSLFQGLAWRDAQVPIPHISREHRLRAASGGIRLNVCETPVTNVRAGQPGDRLGMRVCWHAGTFPQSLT